MKTRSSTCAALIRQELKKLYPEVSFRVKSRDYGDGDAVYVYCDMHKNKDICKDIKHNLQKYSNERDHTKDWGGLVKVTHVLVMHDFLS